MTLVKHMYFIHTIFLTYDCLILEHSHLKMPWMHLQEEWEQVQL